MKEREEKGNFNATICHILQMKKNITDILLLFFERSLEAVV